MTVSVTSSSAKTLMQICIRPFIKFHIFCRDILSQICSNRHGVLLVWPVKGQVGCDELIAAPACFYGSGLYLGDHRYSEISFGASLSWGLMTSMHAVIIIVIKVFRCLGKLVLIYVDRGHMLSKFRKLLGKTASAFTKLLFQGSYAFLKSLKLLK